MTFRIRRRAMRLWILAGGVALASWGSWALAADSTALVRKSRKELIDASIKAPKDPKAGSSALRRAVQHVDEIRLEPKTEAPPAMPEIPPMPPVQPMPIQPVTTEAGQAGPSEPAISEAVVARLKGLSAEKVADPMGLADSLYLGGRLTEAGTFYEKALADSSQPDAKAWALYQMANCRRSTDAAAAMVLYKRVTAEFPKSPWAGVAAAQQRLLEWYQTVNPVAEAKKPAATPELKKPAATLEPKKPASAAADGPIVAKKQASES